MMNTEQGLAWTHMQLPGSLSLNVAASQCFLGALLAGLGLPPAAVMPPSW